MKRPYIIANSGTFLRAVHGGIEDIAEMKNDGGMKWVAVNLGDGQSWEDWRIVVDRARALGVQVFPWARCRTLVECYALLNEADLVGFRACLNLENELETTCPPNKVREVLDDFPEVAVSFSCNGWLPNDPDFSPIAHRPVMLQVFPQDMHRDPAELPQITADCIKHAHDKGFKYVGVTQQAYGLAQPEWYDFWGSKPKSIYAGDDVGAGNWADWA